MWRTCGKICIFVLKSGKKSAMKLIGEYFYNIDSKGRIIIPSEFKEELGDKFFLVKGLEKCLTLYSEKAWEELLQKIEALPISNPYARSFIRFFGSGTKECTLDPQGRITIPTSLKNHADLNKKAVFVGLFNKVEIWSDELWSEVQNQDYKGKPALSEEFSQHIIDLGV